MERDLTKGSELKNIIMFSLPFFFSFFLQVLYGMADLFIVSQFNGTESITAVSIGSQIMHMITVMIVGLAMGGTVAIGKAYGAKNEKETALAMGNTISLFFVVAAALTVVLSACTGPIVSIMSTPVEAVEGTVAYLIICFLGIPFITAYNIISSMYRGLGDSKSPMYFVIVACICNIVLDYIFIGGMNMGTAGAALGTTLSQTISVIIAVVFIRKKNAIRITKESLIPNKKMFASLLKVGIPVSIQDGFIQIAFLVITVFANSRGLADAAAVGIVEKVIGIFFLVPSSMLASVSALAAQNIGAGKTKRARKTLYWALLITTVFGTVVSLITQFCAPSIVGIFETNPAVILLGSQYLVGYVWDCIFAGMHFSFSGYFCAKEKAWLSFIHNVASILLMRIPGAWYASTHFKDTLFPMGLAAPAGSLISVIICLVAFAVITKKDRRLEIIAEEE
ncbi:MAG: MATE family efflux transporter [Lachnospiraceae bacterium]|nr:MATE family efflux transporter [Lachnospiraceae bacterium]